MSNQIFHWLSFFVGVFVLGAALVISSAEAGEIVCACTCEVTQQGRSCAHSSTSAQGEEATNCNSKPCTCSFIEPMDQERSYLTGQTNSCHYVGTI